MQKERSGPLNATAPGWVPALISAFLSLVLVWSARGLLRLDATLQHCEKATSLSASDCGAAVGIRPAIGVASIVAAFALLMLVTWLGYALIRMGGGPTGQLTTE